MILAIDPATTTGWAFTGELTGHDPVWGHKRMGEPGAKNGLVLSTFVRFLSARISEFLPEWIVYESVYVPPPRKKAPGKNDPPPLNAKTLERMFSLTGIIQMVAYDRRIQCYEATAQQISAHFTGHGRWPGGRVGKKRAAVDMCGRYGWHGVTEDEADALALLVYAEAVLYPKAALRRGPGPLFQGLRG